MWLWRAGSWHTLTITTDATGDSAVVPAARRYGESYADTTTLDLPQLAVWITAELLARAADPDTGLAPNFGMPPRSARAAARSGSPCSACATSSGTSTRTPRPNA